MINGESRNWIRFQLTLEAFYTLYNKWPTTIRLYSFFIEELREKLSGNDFQRLQDKIQMIPDDDNPFLASDDEGNEFDYCRGSSPDGLPPERALDWLQVEEPDYYD